eukprot:2319985-Pleurochrysis_carterae.AAC.2
MPPKNAQKQPALPAPARVPAPRQRQCLHQRFHKRREPHPVLLCASRDCSNVEAQAHAREQNVGLDSGTGATAACFSLS